MKFSEIKQDTPRFVVLFNRPAPDQEAWKWGITSGIPLLGLIGYINHVQSQVRDDLEDYLPEKRRAEQVALVIVWDKKEFSYFVHPDIPAYSVIGYLELIKASIVNSQSAQQARNQQIAILGPDGNPIPR